MNYGRGLRSLAQEPGMTITTRKPEVQSIKNAIGTVQINEESKRNKSLYIQYSADAVIYIVKFDRISHGFGMLGWSVV